jgi:hypothetical protein
MHSNLPHWAPATYLTCYGAEWKQGEATLPINNRMTIVVRSLGVLDTFNYRYFHTFHMATSTHFDSLALDQFYPILSYPIYLTSSIHTVRDLTVL